MSHARPLNVTSVPIAEVLANRWSSRALDPEYVIGEADLRALLEAARWAPSASNSQPRRFIAARRGTPTFETIWASLLGFNQVWAANASALIVNLAEAVRDGKPMRWAEYDLGQAVAHLTVEAGHRGLTVRQMGGFNADALREAFDLPAELVPVSIAAVGKLADLDALPDEIRQRELLPRERRGLDELTLVLDL